MVSTVPRYGIQDFSPPDRSNSFLHHILPMFPEASTGWNGERINLRKNISAVDIQPAENRPHTMGRIFVPVVFQQTSRDVSYSTRPGCPGESSSSRASCRGSRFSPTSLPAARYPQQLRQQVPQCPDKYHFHGIKCDNRMCIPISGNNDTIQFLFVQHFFSPVFILAINLGAGFPCLLQINNICQAAVE